MKFRLIAGAGLAGAVAVATALVAIPAQAAEGQIRLANTENSVADSYIVVLKDSAAAREANGLAGEYGAEVSRTFTTALDGFSVHATEAEAKQLAADDEVAYVRAEPAVHHQRHPGSAAVVGPGPARPARPAAGRLLHLRQQG